MNRGSGGLDLSRGQIYRMGNKRGHSTTNPENRGGGGDGPAGGAGADGRGHRARGHRRRDLQRRHARRLREGGQLRRQAARLAKLDVILAGDQVGGRRIERRFHRRPQFANTYRKTSRMPTTGVVRSVIGGGQVEGRWRAGEGQVADSWRTGGRQVADRWAVGLMEDRCTVGQAGRKEPMRMESHRSEVEYTCASSSVERDDMRTSVRTADERRRIGVLRPSDRRSDRRLRRRSPTPRSTTWPARSSACRLTCA
eukprot:1194763-Prorocentrum_minimum.AAC.1